MKDVKDRETSEWVGAIVSPHVKDRIAWTGALEFAGATEDDRTGRTVQFRIMREGADLLDAHPFARYTRRRRGHAGTRFHATFSPIGGRELVNTEVMLLNWVDGPQGATVKFLLGRESDEHPFLNYRRRSAETVADTVMVVLLELDDDDEIVNQAKRERFEKAQQKLSNVAAMMVKHKHFHAWLTEVVGPAPTAEDEAAEQWGADGADYWLKRELSIVSKAELDSDKAAAARFLKIREKYIDWLDRGGYDRD